jgi:hypothetical protein
LCAQGGRSTSGRGGAALAVGEGPETPFALSLVIHTYQLTFLHYLGAIVADYRVECVSLIPDPTTADTANHSGFSY